MDVIPVSTRSATLCAFVACTSFSCSGQDRVLGSRQPGAAFDSGLGFGTGGSTVAGGTGSGGASAAGAGAGGAVANTASGGRVGAGGRGAGVPSVDASSGGRVGAGGRDAALPVADASWGGSTGDGSPGTADGGIPTCGPLAQIVWDPPTCDAQLCPPDIGWLASAGGRVWAFDGNSFHNPTENCSYAVSNGSGLGPVKILAPGECGPTAGSFVGASTVNGGAIYALDSSGPRRLASVPGGIRGVAPLGNGAAACWEVLGPLAYSASLAVFDSSGSAVWQKSIAEFDAASEGRCEAIATDALGNIYSASGNQLQGQRIIKVDSGGTLVWAITNTVALTSPAMATMTTGDLVIAGSQAYGRGEGLFVHAFRADKSPRWAWGALPGMGNRPPLAIDTLNRTYVAWIARSVGSNTPAHTVVLRFSPDGDPCVFADTGIAFDVTALVAEAARIYFGGSRGLGHLDL